MSYALVRDQCETIFRKVRISAFILDVSYIISAQIGTFATVLVRLGHI